MLGRGNLTDHNPMGNVLPPDFELAVPARTSPKDRKITSWHNLLFVSFALLERQRQLTFLGKLD